MTHFNPNPFTNSNWFAFEEEKVIDEQQSSSSRLASASPNTEGTAGSSDDDDVDTSKDFMDSTTSEVPESKPGPDDIGVKKSTPSESDKRPEWIEWRESVSADTSHESLQNGDLEVIPQTDIAAAAAADDDDNLKKEVSAVSSTVDKSETEDKGGKTEKSEAVADSSGKTEIEGSPPE